MVMQCQEWARAEFPVGLVGTAPISDHINLNEARARTWRTKLIITHPMGISSGRSFRM